MRYAISVASLLFAFCVISTLNDNVEACSCQANHPQAMFCTSQYVIKALVQRSRIVRLRPDGKYKTVITDETEIVDEPEIDENEVVEDRNNTANSTDEDDNDSNPGHHSVGFVDETTERNDDGRDDDDDSYAERGGEDDQNDHGPPAEDGRNHTTRPRRSIREWRHRRHYYRGYSPGSKHQTVRPSSMTMVQYRIRIVQIYKGLENTTEQQKRFLYVPPPPLCNVELKTGGNPYIFMGQIFDGVLRINACNFKLDMSQITRDERRNLVHNLEDRYPKSCETCRVKVCYGYNCNEDEVEPSSCEWKDWWTAKSAWACQYSCLPTKKGPCKWYNPLNQAEKRRRSL